MAQNLFIWVAHPKAGSFCQALADAYAAGAKTSGIAVKMMELSAMAFSSDTLPVKHQEQADLEEDLKLFQDNILWADHILIVHPYWWGGIPARTKAVIDRTFLPGFAYKYHARGMGWDKLLTGHTADVIITSDTPTWIDTIIYRAPTRRIWKNQILGFCGIKPRQIKQFGSVKLSDEKKRHKWLQKATFMGQSLGRFLGQDKSQASGDVS